MLLPALPPLPPPAIAPVVQLVTPAGQPQAPVCAVVDDTHLPAVVAAVVRAERAFARLSVDSGAQTAFVTHLAADAVLFRPGPVPGTTYLRERPMPDGMGTLAWTPHWAGASAAGDLGFTSGPWTIARGGRVVAHGTFNSVWRRGTDGRWRALLDVGVGDTTTARRAAAVDGVASCAPVRVAPVAAAPRMRRGAASARDSAAALAAVWRADSLLGREASHPAHGLAARLAPDARLVREHRAVLDDADAVRAEARDVAGRLHGVPLGAGVARSGDLAYSYGSYTLDGDGATAAERGHYLRVWRATARGWSLLLDVTNALPAAPAAPRASASPAAAVPGTVAPSVAPTPSAAAPDAPAARER